MGRTTNLGLRSKMFLPLGDLAVFMISRLAANTIAYRISRLAYAIS